MVRVRSRFGNLRLNAGAARSTIVDRMKKNPKINDEFKRKAKHAISPSLKWGRGGEGRGGLNNTEQCCFMNSIRREKSCF